MTGVCPGLDPRRLALLVQAAVERCQLDLSGAVVLTEAATGAYAVTPVLAALAGASEVVALTRSTRHGSVDEVRAETTALAERVGVDRRIRIVTRSELELAGRADIITNSGHVRPLDAALIDGLKPTAVIPLMYEAWEFRPGDIDCGACRRRGIPVGATNERHPALDVFSFLGILAVKLLLDAGIAVYGSSIMLLCDNPFSGFIEHGLSVAGARVDTCRTLRTVAPEKEYDALLLALQPRGRPVLAAEDLEPLSPRWDGTVIAQFWGDIDRPGLLAAGKGVWPPAAPEPGHMGILLSALGPEPIVRLQAGGLKVGEMLWRARSQGKTLAEVQRALLDSGYGTLLTEVLHGSEELDDGIRS